MTPTLYTTANKTTVREADTLRGTPSHTRSPLVQGAERDEGTGKAGRGGAVDTRGNRGNNNNVRSEKPEKIAKKGNMGTRRSATCITDL